MTAITADQAFDAPTIPSLRFATSESKAVGLGGKWMGYLKDNAASVVGGLYVLGAAACLLQGSVMIGVSGILGIIGNAIKIRYGNKQYQQKLAQRSNSLEQTVEGHGVIANLSRAMKPSAYPIEAGAVASMATNTFYTGYGAIVETITRSELEADSWLGKLVNYEGLEEAAAEAGNDPSGITAIIVGGIAVAAAGYMLLGKEEEKDKEQSLRFSQSTSKPKGLIGSVVQKMKDNPVLSSSLVFMALASYMIYGSLKDNEMVLAAVGTLAFTANVVQALFVRKKDFSIEGAKDQEQETTPFFAEKELTRRQMSGQLAR